MVLLVLRRRGREIVSDHSIMLKGWGEMAVILVGILCMCFHASRGDGSTYCTEKRRYDKGTRKYVDENTLCHYGCCGTYPSQYCCAVSIEIAVAGLVGAIVGLCLLIVVVCCCVKKFSKSPNSVEPGAEGNGEGGDLAMDPRMAYFRPRTPHRTNINVVYAGAFGQHPGFAWGRHRRVTPLKPPPYCPANPPAPPPPYSLTHPSPSSSDTLSTAPGRSSDDHPEGTTTLTTTTTLHSQPHTTDTDFSDSDQGNRPSTTTSGYNPPGDSPTVTTACTSTGNSPPGSHPFPEASTDTGRPGTTPSRNASTSAETSPPVDNPRPSTSSGNSPTGDSPGSGTATENSPPGVVEDDAPPGYTPPLPGSFVSCQPGYNPCLPGASDVNRMPGCYGSGFMDHGGMGFHPAYGHSGGSDLYESDEYDSLTESESQGFFG